MKFYAVGWQNYLPVNMREIKFKSGFSKYINVLKFENDMGNSLDSLLDKFNQAKTELTNVETTGNNRDILFYSKVDHSLDNEKSRILRINDFLKQDIPILTNFDDIRFYILECFKDQIKYRFYIKAIRTAKIKSRILLTKCDNEYKIVDIEDESKVLPIVISYAEIIDNSQTTQYIFDIQSYEEMFGINEAKVQNATENLDKFLTVDESGNPIFNVAGDYRVEITDEERAKIKQKIKGNRRLANKLSKYTNEASEFDWDDIKRANELSKLFLQTPFSYDEVSKKIFVTEDSLEAWVSVITNSKKLGIAANRYEDSIATKNKEAV